MGEAWELQIAILVDEAEAERVREDLLRRVMGSAVAARREPPETDLRILPVHFDHSEERWRTLEECVARYEEEDFADFPVSGPRTMARDVRQLRRLNSDFLKQHEEWARMSGAKAADRSVHEHATIARALHFMVCYDQLQVCNLAGADCLNRRRALIEAAHLGHPESPSYEGAEDYLGVVETLDGSVVDPALTMHVASRQSATAEVWKKARVMREEKEAARRAAASKGKKGDKGDDA